MSVSSAATAAEKPEKQPRKIGYKAGVSLVGLLIIVMAITLPVAAINLVESIREPATDQLRLLIEPPDTEVETYTILNIEVVSIDEVQQLMTLRVSGAHVCKMNCNYKEKYTFYSIGASVPGILGLPPSESLTIPATANEVNTRFQLPINSNLIAYPFDRMELTLGVTAERIASDNTVTRVPDDEARNELLATVLARIPRLNLEAPQSIPPHDVRPIDVPNFDYLAVQHLTFYRPIYLKVLVTLVALLITTAAAYAAFLRPFDQLIINAGALVLGVYGIRSLILGSLPNDVTSLDIYLTCVVLFLLCTIAVRGFNYLHMKSGWRIPGAAVEKEKTTRTCPFCKTDIEKDATRCPHCTSVVEPETDEVTAATAEAAAAPVPEPVPTPRSVPPGVPWMETPAAFAPQTATTPSARGNPPGPPSH